jgi:hypothetical protein
MKCEPMIAIVEVWTSSGDVGVVITNKVVTSKGIAMKIEKPNPRNRERYNRKKEKSYTAPIAIDRITG